MIPQSAHFSVIQKKNLKKHIKITHNKKTYLQCSVCMLDLRDLDALAEHMNRAHRKETHDLKCNICHKNFRGDLDEHIESEHKQFNHKSNNTLKCNICKSRFKTKDEIIVHIAESHKSHKPCDLFAEDNCDLDVKCRYKHIKLQEGEHNCYKCGHISKSKRYMMNHVKEKHGHEICHKFIEGKCSYSRCLFSHKVTNVITVENVSKIVEQRSKYSNTAPTETDFVNLPTTGPVGTKEMARSQAPAPPALQGRPQEVEAQEKNMITKVIEMLIPQIVTQVSEALLKASTSH